MGTRQVLAKPVTHTGTHLLEALTQADLSGNDLTFTEAVEYVSIYNAHATNSLTATVNGVVITVPAVTGFGPAKVGTTPGTTVIMGGTSNNYSVMRWE